MGVTDVAVRLSQFPKGDTSKIHVQVQTDAKYGFGSTGGIHLWDAKGNTADVPLTWSSFLGQDGLWVGPKGEFIDTPPTLDPATLGSTAWVDSPNGTRIWEQQNHPVQPQGEDRLVPTQPLDNQVSTVSFPTVFGKIDFTYNDLDAHDYKDDFGQQAITGIVLTDTSNQFATTKELKILLMPQVRYTTDGVPWDMPTQTKDIMDLNSENMITLKRQLNGTFVHEAPAGQALLLENWVYQYMQNRHQMDGLRFALVDPLNNTWFKNGSDDYFTNVPLATIP